MTNTRKPNRALVLIDVQNEYVTGNLPIEYPPLAISLTNIATAIETAQKHSIPIVLVQQMAPETSPIFAKGSHGWELHPVVATLTPDLFIHKQLPSALAGTELAEWLKKEEIDTLTVAGYMTQNCNESTIRQAAHEGWSVEFLHDAAGTVSFRNSQGQLKAEDMHKAACVVLQSRFAAVMTTQEWTHCIQSGNAPIRDSIYQSYKQAHV
jgi:nicotinamidase-related amidase